MSKSPISNIRWMDKTVIVDVSGDIDLHRSSQLQQGLLGVLSDKPSRILINFSGVPYMDSSGVASLVKLLSRTKKIGIPLVLVALSDKVLSILEITRLDSVFTISPTEEEAMS